MSVLFYENEGKKSIANDRVPTAGLQGGLSGMNQYQVSNCSCDFCDSH